MSGFLIARQHVVDSALARASLHFHLFQNEVALILELRKLRHSGDGRVDLGKDEAACLVLQAAVYISPRGSASGPNRWQHTSPAMRPVLPLPRATDETARRTSAAVDALHEVPLMRKQAHLLAAQNTLRNGQVFKEGNDPFGACFLPGEPRETAR